MRWAVSELPDGWTEAPLDTLLSSLETGSCPKGGVDKFTDGIPSLGGEHIGAKGDFKFGKLKYVPVEFAKKMTRGKIKIGDVLIVKDGATTGKCSLVKTDFPYKEAFVNEHVFICRLQPDFDSRYFAYYLRSQEGQKQILSNFRGAAQGGITQSFAPNTIVPLAPLDEQKRIAEKLDSLLSRVDSCQSHLERVPQILKRFRQSVLAAATSGRLTEDWREENKIELHSWEKIVVCDSFTSFSGGTPSRANKGYWNGEIGWLSSGDIKKDVIDSSSETITSLGLENSSSKIAKAGSVIAVVRSGILKHTFPVATLALPFALNQDIKCFDSGNILLNYWLALTWRANQHIILAEARDGTTVQSVRFETLKNWELLVPPPEEQAEIVRRVERLFGYAERLEASYQAASRDVARLTPSLLAKAFRGELVTGDG